jgi:hypothetical protein
MRLAFRWNNLSHACRSKNKRGDDWTVSKKKSKSGKVILSERIINIGELESFIRSAYMDTVRVRTLVEDGRADTEQILSYLQSIQLTLLKAKDFDFFLEKRKVIVNSHPHRD